MYVFIYLNMHTEKKIICRIYFETIFHTDISQTITKKQQVTHSIKHDFFVKYFLV